ncbi:MAG: YabP/YqfC family sporulation protein [Clostridiales bacterium]|jgi:sporulation protein YabP|nr:YabP/YqfC family sporulation protein [Clostridiales bacterium]
MAVTENGGNKAQVKRLHVLHMEGNARLSLTGVLNVKNYNDKEITLILSDYILIVGGDALNIDRLNIEEGNVVIDGTILSLRYVKALEKGSFLKRLGK